MQICPFQNNTPWITVPDALMEASVMLQLEEEELLTEHFLQEWIFIKVVISALRKWDVVDDFVIARTEAL